MERKPPVKISILEKDESEVSHCWKFCQLFSYILVVISGIATSLAMGNIQRMFNHECLLYADLAVATESNWTIIILPHHASRWGSFGHCDFCQYCPVASVIFAGIWGTIFIMCGRGGASSRNLPQPWRIIPPAILFNFIFLVLSCVSVALTCGGFSAFCASIAPQLGVESCEDIVGFFWERYPDANYFYDDVVIAQLGASVGLAGWLMGFVILLIRVITHADFRVVGPDRKSSGSSEEGSPTNLSTIISGSNDSTSNSLQSTNNSPSANGGQPSLANMNKTNSTVLYENEPLIINGSRPRCNSKSSAAAQITNSNSPTSKSKN